MTASRVAESPTHKPQEPRKIPDAKQAERLQRKLAAAEERIVTLEKEQKEVEAQIAAAYEGGKSDGATPLLARATEIQRSIEEGFAELEKLSTELGQLQQ